MYMFDMLGVNLKHFNLKKKMKSKKLFVTFSSFFIHAQAIK